MYGKIEQNKTSHYPYKMVCEGNGRCLSYITFLFLSNPNGYPGENSDVDFDANFVLEL